MSNLTTYSEETFQASDPSEFKSEDACFEACTFEKCHFANAQFTNCTFEDCAFKACDASLLSLKNCLLKNVTFTDSKLVGIKWSETSRMTSKLYGGLKFYRAMLDYGIFFGMDLKGMVMKDCSCKEVDFSEADLEKSDFEGTDFSGAIFNNTNLKKSDFGGACNYDISIYANKISKAKFALPEAMALLKGLDITIL